MFAASNISVDETEADNEQKTYITLGETSTATNKEQLDDGAVDVDNQWQILDEEESVEVIKSDGKNTKSTKQQRYWHSWEELRFVELWRRHKDEISIQGNKSLLVYRQIVNGMKKFGFIVTSQDCRRKINALTKQYLMESKRSKASGTPSTWRLYPFVTAILEPPNVVENDDPWHEMTIVRELLEEVQNGMNNVNNSTKEIPVSFNQEQEEKSQFFPLHLLTTEKLDEIREENQRLTQERDDSLDDLLIELDCFEKFEKFLNNWLQQQEQFLNFNSLQQFDKDICTNLTTIMENDILTKHFLQAT